MDSFQLQDRLWHHQALSCWSRLKLLVCSLVMENAPPVYLSIPFTCPTTYDFVPRLGNLSRSPITTFKYLFTVSDSLSRRNPSL